MQWAIEQARNNAKEHNGKNKSSLKFKDLFFTHWSFPETDVGLRWSGRYSLRVKSVGLLPYMVVCSNAVTERGCEWERVFMIHLYTIQALAMSLSGLFECYFLFVFAKNMYQ